MGRIKVMFYLIPVVFCVLTGHVNLVDAESCPWETPTGQANLVQCGDKYYCDVSIHGWSCCVDHQGLEKCPPGYLMCAAKKCEGNRQHCCEHSCDSFGGLRVCDTASELGKPLRLNGRPLPTIIERSQNLEVTGDGIIHTFAMGGGGGGATGGGGGSGYIATGTITVKDGDTLHVVVGQGGEYGEDGGDTRVGDVVARGGKSWWAWNGGDGYSGGGGRGSDSGGRGGTGGQDGESGTGSPYSPGGSGQNIALPSITTDRGTLVPGSGGVNDGVFGGGGGGVTFSKKGRWTEYRGEGYGGGGAGRGNKGTRGIVILS